MTSKRSLVSKLKLLCVVASVVVILTVAANASDTQPQSQPTTETLLLKSFGPAVEAVTSFAPYQLTGDFNGDGMLDTLVIVRIKGSRSQLPKDVTVLNPFYGKTVKFPAHPQTEPTLAIAIIHGGSKRKPEVPAGKFLLIGESPVLIQENSRAISGELTDRQYLMYLVKKRDKRSPTALRPPAIARGDAVSLPTEAADSILYWNGKTYRWQESKGGE